MGEIWRDVRGYEGCYKISNQGRIKSFKWSKEGRILSNVKSNGYEMIKLSKNGSYKWQSLHRLVANNFIDNHYSKEQVNHIDGNPSNNNVSNLEWVTHKENIQHSYDKGHREIIKGELHGQAILTNEQVLEIHRLANLGMSTQKEIGDKFGVSGGTVSDIKLKKRWIHLLD